MVEYSIIAVNGTFKSLGSFLPHLQGFYREFGLHLSPQESLMVSGGIIGFSIAVLIWMVSK